MLSVQNVSAGYDETPVLKGVSADVGDGEFVGIIGPNGCGKTTLLRVISGVLGPTEGAVLLDGRRIADIPQRELARTLTCLSQDLKLDFPFTVREVAFMGRTPHLPRIGRESPRDWEIVRNAMELADIAPLADRPITEISGGERQRVFIAMCLAQEPRLLLLDEPTSHLDVGHQLSILRLIRRLNIETGLTVVAVFHDLNLASEFCGRLLVMHRGEVEADGPPEEVLTVAMIHKVYGTDVLAERNPVSGRPHIVVTAESE